MRRHVTLTALFLIGIAQLAPAQTPQPGPIAADSQVRSSDDTQIILEVRRLVLPDEFVKSLPARSNLTLPEMSSCGVLDNAVTEYLVNLTTGDRMPTAGAVPPIKLRNGEVGCFPAYGPAYHDTVEAKLSSDRQAIEIHLVWAKWEDGKDRLPPMNAVIPLGSHLLIHDRTCAFRKRSDSFFDGLLEKVFPNRKHETEYQQEYLLVSPRIALQSQTNENDGTPISLEVRCLTLNDNFFARVGTSDLRLTKLPEMGCLAIYDQNQTKRLVDVVLGDTRSSAFPVSTVTVLDGEQHHFLPEGTYGCRPQRFNDAVQATVSKDRQAIEVQLTWAERQDNEDNLPAMTASVPMGASLLVHTHDALVLEPIPPSSLGQIADQLLSRKRMQMGKVTEQGFLLITPRIAAERQDAIRTAAR